MREIDYGVLRRICPADELYKNKELIDLLINQCVANEYCADVIESLTDKGYNYKNLQNGLLSILGYHLMNCE